MKTLIIIDKPTNDTVKPYSSEELYTLDEAKAYFEEKYQEYIKKVFKNGN